MYLVVLTLPLASFHQASAPREYLCTRCGKKSARRGLMAWIASVVIILGLVGFTFMLLVGLLLNLR